MFLLDGGAALSVIVSWERMDRASCLSRGEEDGLVFMLPSMWRVVRPGPVGSMSFTAGAKDGKHYWLTPKPLMDELQTEFKFNYDPCPYPRPDGYDGLSADWGSRNYVNPPFGGVVFPDGKKRGATAWARKCIEEYKKGKTVVMVYPIDKWVLMLLDAGAKVRNLKDVRWCATEDGLSGKGTGRHIAMFILDPAGITDR